MEKLRDPSHFRAYRVSEWERYVIAAGLTFGVAHRFVTPINREDWMAQMSVPAPVAEEVRRRFAEAPTRAKDAFGITGTDFHLHKAIMIGRKP